MSEVRYAVVYFWTEQGILLSEVWYEDLDLQDAEDMRSSELNNEPDLDPQNLQVIQYNL